MEFTLEGVGHGTVIDCIIIFFYSQNSNRLKTNFQKTFVTSNNTLNKRNETQNTRILVSKTKEMTKTKMNYFRLYVYLSLTY